MNNVYTCVSERERERERERDGGREKERELNSMYVVLCACDCMQCGHTVHVHRAQFKNGSLTGALAV